MAYSSKPKLYSRYFNKLEDRGRYIEKCSILREKLAQEYAFLSAVPEEIKEFFPHVHSFTEKANQSSYMIEKIETLDASYYLIDPRLYSDKRIKDLIHHLFAYLSKVPKKHCHPSEFMQSVKREILDKNTQRVAEVRTLPVAWELEDLAAKKGFGSIEGYLLEMNKAIHEAVGSESSHDLYFSHGDLCFSNILLVGEKIFLIDPKGAPFPDQNYRSIHYDLAKISHSLMGHYDLINHELFDLSDGDIHYRQAVPEGVLAIAEFRNRLSEFGTSLRTIRLIEASFFLSMIPLHKESHLKMKAFFLNSMAIFRRVL